MVTTTEGIVSRLAPLVFILVQGITGQPAPLTQAPAPHPVQLRRGPPRKVEPAPHPVQLGRGPPRKLEPTHGALWLSVIALAARYTRLVAGEGVGTHTPS